MEQSIVLRVLIASPGDVPKERIAARKAVEDWNSRYSLTRSIVLLPVMWERDLPNDGTEMPQPLINRHLVDQCDICIGIFWSRIGTPTSKHEGGAVEEVYRMIEANKQIMVFFGRRAVDIDHDAAQLRSVRELEDKLKRERGIGTYLEASDLQQLISMSLDHHVTQALDKAPRSDFAGKWLEIKHVKEKETEHPFALVDITKKDSEYTVRGCSYAADGQKGIPWPAGHLDVTIQQNNMLIHCFDANHQGAQATGLSCYQFLPHSTSSDGHGFYSQQAEGPGLTSTKVEFTLKRVTPKLWKYHFLQRKWHGDDKDMADLIRSIHREKLFRRIAITGGPHSGKTALLKELSVQKYRTIGEAALEIIKELGQSKGSDFSNWRNDNFKDFQMKIFERQRNKDRLQWNDVLPGAAVPVFMDRTAVDCIAYLADRDLPVPAELSDYVDELSISEVFILDTIEPYDMRVDSGRESTLEDSQRIRDRLDETYVNLGYTTHRLPVASIQERLKLVLSAAGTGPDRLVQRDG